MPFSPQTLEEKPYNLCLNCVHIGKKCDGPNFLTMSTERWCEWCRLRKDYLGWTNAHVAELAVVSKITIDRIMSGNVKDLRTTTMQAVTKALVNGTWGTYPCAMAALENNEPIYIDNPVLIERAVNLQATIDQQAADHKLQIDFLKGQLVSKDSQLADHQKEHKRRGTLLGIVTAALIVALLLIITALVVDLLNHDIGFFWLSP